MRVGEEVVVVLRSGLLLCWVEVEAGSTKREVLLRRHRGSVG
jgi:hypothetical protein